MARTEALRALGGFDGRFRRCAERDLAIRAALRGAHFISVDAPLVTQYLTPSADKGGNAELRYRLLLVRKYKRYLKKKRSYAGAWCYMHAHFYRGRDWRWRLWYLAALVCFPRDVSWARMRRSSLLARLAAASRKGGVILMALLGRSPVVTARRRQHDRVSRFGSRPATDWVIVLNCFGRGGSGIVWRMIGSSPDVIMTRKEWHVAVFGERRRLRRALLAMCRSAPIRSSAPFQRYALGKTREMQRPVDVATKADARSLVVKLMDYHLVFAQTIGASFERATFINLTRHPYGQCESLMRSGLSLEEACRWYVDVARMMAKQVESGAITVRFEDMCHPSDRDLRRALPLPWRAVGRGREVRVQGQAVRD